MAAPARQEVDRAAAVPADAELIPVGSAATMLGCSPNALKKLAQARQPKVRGLAPGQGRNTSHQWVFVRDDIEQRMALTGRGAKNPPAVPALQADRDNLAAAYELAEESRRQEREDHLRALLADRERRVVELEAERDRLWDALEALRPARGRKTVS